MSDMITAEDVTIGLDDDRIKFFADRLLEVARIRAAAKPSDGESDKEDLASYAGEVVTLRRTVIALHAQLADAKAAQAMVVERTAELCDRVAAGYEKAGDAAIGCGVRLTGANIRALADTDGMALVQALRAELGRLREIIRVNGLRSGATDAEIDAVLYPKSQEAAK